MYICNSKAMFGRFYVIFLKIPLIWSFGFQSGPTKRWPEVLKRTIRKTKKTSVCSFFVSMDMFTNFRNLVRILCFCAHCWTMQYNNLLYSVCKGQCFRSKKYKKWCTVINIESREHKIISRQYISNFFSQNLDWKAMQWFWRVYLIPLDTISFPPPAKVLEKLPTWKSKPVTCLSTSPK